MSVENPTTIEELQPLWPLAGDVTKEGDDHIRNLKGMLQLQFPGVLGNGFAIPIIATEEELNWLTGLTSNIQAQIDALSANLMAPVGTVMSFYQAAAPIGWTQDVSKNDYMMRVVSGTGGGSGGSSSPITAHTHTTAAHALTESEMPSHTHTQMYVTATGIAGNWTPGRQYGSGVATNSAVTTASTGGGGSHSHGDTGSSFTPYYIDCILASKD